MRALLLVDIQNDFAPGGALAVPNGDDVVATANRLMPAYDFVVATKDWHPPDHVSFASQHAGVDVGEVIQVDGLDQIMWPDHCIMNTPGAAFCPGLATEGIDEVLLKGDGRSIDSYSGFFDNGHRRETGLADMLRDHGVDEIDVMGLATDYCVKFTALDARRLGFQTRLLLEGCRGVERETGDCARAIEAMRTAGVEIVGE